MSKTENERVEFLQGLGLSADGDSLANEPAKVVPTRQEKPVDVKLAPPGVDPRTMPVDEIRFDPALLDKFPSLTDPDGLKAATDYVFSLYKSYGRDKHRNSTLWREIKKFIAEVRRTRETGGYVKEKVKTSKPERELAQVIASQGLSAGDLAEALALLAEKRGEANG